MFHQYATSKFILVNRTVNQCNRVQLDPTALNPNTSTAISRSQRKRFLSIYNTLYIHLVSAWLTPISAASWSQNDAHNSDMKSSKSQFLAQSLNELHVVISITIKSKQTVNNQPQCIYDHVMNNVYLFSFPLP